MAASKREETSYTERAWGSRQVQLTPSLRSVTRSFTSRFLASILVFSLQRDVFVSTLRSFYTKSFENLALFE